MNKNTIRTCHWLASALAAVFALAGVFILFTATPFIALYDFVPAITLYGVRRIIRFRWPEFDWPLLSPETDIRSLADKFIERHGVLAHHFSRQRIKEATAAGDDRMRAQWLHVRKLVIADLERSIPPTERRWYSRAERWVLRLLSLIRIRPQFRYHGPAGG